MGGAGKEGGCGGEAVGGAEVPAGGGIRTEARALIA